MSTAINPIAAEQMLTRAVPLDTAPDGWPTEAAAADCDTARYAAELRARLLRDGAAVLCFPDRFGDHELTVATWNLLTQLAEPVPQYETGELVFRVEVRPGQDGASHYSATSATGGLHTDGSLLPQPPDLALLMCLSAADRGGETVLVEVDALYAHLRRSAPELIETLREPHPFLAPDRPAGEAKWAPILGFTEEGAARLRYLRRYLESGWMSLSGAVPPSLTAAMDAIDEFTMAEENQTPYLLRRGQLLLWRNERYIHGRRAFSEQAVTRQLVRMYARDEARKPADAS